MRPIDGDELIAKLGIGHDCSVCEKNDTPYCRWKPNVVDVCEAISDAPTIEPERKPGKWIPCSERLPEESGRYLISVLDGVGRRTTVAPYQPRYKAWTMTGRMAYWKVIAWLPLPEPYRGEEK